MNIDNCNEVTFLKFIKNKKLNYNFLENINLNNLEFKKTNILLRDNIVPTKKFFNTIIKHTSYNYYDSIEKIIKYIMIKKNFNLSYKDINYLKNLEIKNLESDLNKNIIKYTMYNIYDIIMNINYNFFKYDYEFCILFFNNQNFFSYIQESETDKYLKNISYIYQKDKKIDYYLINLKIPIECLYLILKEKKYTRRGSVKLQSVIDILIPDINALYIYIKNFNDISIFLIDKYKKNVPSHTSLFFNKMDV